MVITAKFESRCGRCSGLITLGTKVEWSRGKPAVHIVCPQSKSPEDPNRAAVLRALAASRGETVEPVTAAQAAQAPAYAVAAPADPNVRRLISKYDGRCSACGSLYFVNDPILWSPGQKARHEVCPEVPVRPMAESAPNTARAEALKKLPKGIYRVSLTGLEKKYGVDYVNVALVPNEKKGTVKISEWQGVSVGFVSPLGTVNYWRQSQWSDAVDPSDPRVKAVVAALDIILGAADPVEFAKAYAREAKNCWRCGADLVDEKSCERLMGPDCFRMQYGKGA